MLATTEERFVVGEFDPSTGELRWSGQPYKLRAASAEPERYALVVGETEVARFDRWGRGPTTVDIVRPEAIDPGLMLFTAFAVRGLDSG